MLIVRWVLSALALMITVKLGEMLGVGLSLDSSGSAFLAALVMGLINVVILPVVRLLTLPLTCLTFGLFGLLLNVLMFWVVGGPLGNTVGFHVTSFWAALFGSVCMGVFSGLFNGLLTKRK